MVNNQHTLYSYSSADSLLKRTIKRASPRKRPPGGSGSPSRGLRTRPRSPLAEHSDFDDDSDHPVPWQSMLVQSPPLIVSYPTHPSRQSSFESSSSHISRGTGVSQRSAAALLPMAMAMTSIATPGDKDKDKEKEKDKEKRQAKGPKPFDQSEREEMENLLHELRGHLGTFELPRLLEFPILSSYISTLSYSFLRGRGRRKQLLVPG